MDASCLTCSPIPDGPDVPRSLRGPSEREARRVRLSLAHVAPLAHYAARLRERGSVEVPEFDPLDGGTQAEALFLFEKPGPMTAAEGRGNRVGSGFISRDNDDPTAEAIFRFMVQAGIPRRRTLIWNTIPWWNGTRKIVREELQAGIRETFSLIGFLPRLKAIVLVGRRAEAVRPSLDASGLPVFVSAHPSPLVRASRPAVWERIPEQWAQVHPHLTREEAFR